MVVLCSNSERTGPSVKRSRSAEPARNPLQARTRKFEVFLLSYIYLHLYQTTTVLKTREEGAKRGTTPDPPKTLGLPCRPAGGYPRPLASHTHHFTSVSSCCNARNPREGRQHKNARNPLLACRKNLQAFVQSNSKMHWQVPLPHGADSGSRNSQRSG
jgi:hypothetical protein